MKSTAFLSIALTASVSLSLLFCSPQPILAASKTEAALEVETASEVETDAEVETALTSSEPVSTLLYEPAILTDGELELSAETITLDYQNQSVTLSYTLSNPSDSEQDCLFLFPFEATLGSSGSQKLTFSGALEEEELPISEDHYLTSLTNSIGSDASVLSAETLEAFYHKAPTVIPTLSGSLYRLTRTDGSSAQETCLKITTLSEDCRIYPLAGNYYKADDTHYDISCNQSSDYCYVFLSGEENEDYSIEEANPAIFFCQTDDFTYEEFLSVSCEWYLSTLEEPISLDQNTLMLQLADYLSAEKLQISMDLLPTIQWLLNQTLFDVSRYELTLPADATVELTASISLPLSVSSTTIRPGLLAHSLTPQQLSLQLLYPESYTNANITGGFHLRLSEDGLGTPESYPTEEYQIKASKAPVWEMFYPYLLPLTIGMLVFLALCVIVSLLRRKQQPTADEKKNPKA